MEPAKEPTRSPPGRFALGVAVLAGPGVMYTCKAFSGGKDWRGDIFCAMGFWLLLALIVSDHFCWYKLRKSSRLAAIGVSGVGLGIFCLASTVFLGIPDISAAVLVTVVSVFMIVRGLWLRAGDRETGVPTDG